MPRVPRRESTGRVWPPSLLGSVQEVLPRQVLRSHVLGSRDAIGDRRPTRQPRIRHRPTENTYRGCYLPPTQQCDSNAPECDAAEGHANGVRRTFPPCRERRALRSLPGCPLGRGLPAFLPSARPRRTIRRFCHGPVHARHLIPKKPCNSPRQMLQLDQIGTHRLVPRRTLRNSILLIWRVQENLRRDSLWDAGGVALLTQADFGSHCRTSQQRRPVGGCQNRARPLQAAPSLGK